MRLYRATMEDCASMHRLSSMPGLSGPHGEAPPLCWFESFVSEGQYAYVIRDGAQVAAFAIGERTCGNIGLIWMLGVDEKHRNLGLATRLMKHIEKRMKSYGLRVIISYGYTGSPEMLHLLKKLKYRPGSSYVEHVRFLK